jgi:hypothetical protein
MTAAETSVDAQPSAANSAHTPIALRDIFHSIVDEYPPASSHTRAGVGILHVHGEESRRNRRFPHAQSKRFNDLRLPYPIG